LAVCTGRRAKAASRRSGAIRLITSRTIAPSLRSRASSSSAAAPNPWAPGTQWLTLRAGYAKSTTEGAADGGAGYGFGYSRQLRPVKVNFRRLHWTLFRRWALGGYVHYEVLGRFRGAAEIEAPASLEMVRQFRWSAQMRPYLGFGGGPFYRKGYRTGEDFRDVTFGKYVTFGANVPISNRHLVGVDFRFIRLDASNIPANPVFGMGSAKLHDGIAEAEDGTHWSVKLSYSLAY